MKYKFEYTLKYNILYIKKYRNCDEEYFALYPEGTVYIESGVNAIDNRGPARVNIEGDTSIFAEKYGIYNYSNSHNNFIYNFGIYI